MSATDTTEKTTLIAGMRGEDYDAAFQTLVLAAKLFYDDLVDDLDGIVDEWTLDAVYQMARQLQNEIQAQDYRPRQKRTFADQRRHAITSLAQAIEEYQDVHQLEHGALGLDVFDGLENAIRLALRYADQTADSEGYAPEDDSNPIVIVPVPVPDPAAGPINANGVLQGDWVWASYEDTPRQILSGPTESDWGTQTVRLSDPRDGGKLWGGLGIDPDRLGTDDYPKVDGPDAPNPHKPDPEELAEAQQRSIDTLKTMCQGLLEVIDQKNILTIQRETEKLHRFVNTMDR